MAITPLSDGSIITTADIEGVHADVRSIINSIGDDEVRRATFNENHVDSLVVATGSANVNAYVNTYTDVAVGSTSPGSVVSDWQQLASITSYTGPVAGPQRMYIYFCGEATRWSSHDPRYTLQIVAIVKHSGISASFPVGSLSDLKWVRTPDEEGNGTVWASEGCLSIDLATIHSVVGSGDLEYVRLYGVFVDVGAGVGKRSSPTNAVLVTGTLSFIILEGE